MAFDKGSVSFRLFYLKNGLARSALEKFADRAAPPIDTLGSSPVRGWVSPRHLLDRWINEDKCLFPPWLHIVAMQAEKKIPPKLLRAYCRMEEDIVMRAEHLEFLTRKRKSEIKARVTDELLPQMPPTLSGTPAVVNLDTGFVMAEAMSDSSMDKFAALFRETTGEQPYVVTPNGLAILRRQVNANDLAPATFTDDETIEPDAACDLGCEFLTWLLYRFDLDGCPFSSSTGDACSIALEGPVSFFRKGKGAHVAAFREGNPLYSPEAMLSILCGKKARGFKLSLAIGQKVWSAAIDSSFAVRGLRLPKDPENEFPSFEERMLDVEAFTKALFVLFDVFLEKRADKRAWSREERDVRKWVRRRAAEPPADLAEDGR